MYVFKIQAMNIQKYNQMTVNCDFVKPRVQY